MVKVCLDAGHGGKDPGAISVGRQEKDYTLRFVLAIGEILERYGVDVVYTRKDDRFLELYERAAICNKNSCDYFASQHVNAGGGTGIETYAHNNSTKGKQFATVVQNAMVANNVVIKNRGVKTANFAVLRLTNCPAILIENGFIDSPSDMLFIDSNFDTLVQVQAKAILEFIGIKYVGDAVENIQPVEQPKPTPQPQPQPQKDPIQEAREYVGARAKELQEKLIALGYNCGGYGADGKFGKGTYDSLIKFQGDNGLTQDALAGTQTFAKLEELLAERNKPKINEEVLTIQKKLRRLQILDDSGNQIIADGILGDKSKQAIKRFQTICGLSADSIWGTNTENAYQQIISKPLCGLKYVQRIPTRYIQYRLGISIDGRFGRNTANYVMRYQANNKLRNDGIVGNNTWYKLIG